MQLDPPRIGERPLGIGSKYLVIVGGIFPDHERYKFVDITDITTNEQTSIPFPSSWDPYANAVVLDIYMLQKVVVFIQAGALSDNVILVIDLSTKSTTEILSPGIRRATTNGTHLFASTRIGPQVLDVDQMTWSALPNFPLTLPSTHQNSWIYLRAIDAIALIPSLGPLTFKFYALNGTEIRSLPGNNI